jgi:RimJ/RimL family protein N-acetyltransferase
MADEPNVVTPPYRIETSRLVIRCWDPRDAPQLKDALDTSLEHLRGWLPWAREEPKPLGEKIELLRRFRGMFDLGDDFVYGIFSRDEEEVVGGAGLHRRVGAGAFEIGYWLRASRTGQGLATEMVAALTRVAFDVCQVERVEIRVDPENERSLRIPRRLGYVAEATLRRRLPPNDLDETERRDVVVFAMFAHAFAQTPRAGEELTAYDSVGTRLQLGR